MGRFITEDPIKDGNNWYVYCYNNPLTYTDPTGLYGNPMGDPNAPRNNQGNIVNVSGENHGMKSINERGGIRSFYSGRGSMGNPIGENARTSTYNAINNQLDHKEEFEDMTPEEQLRYLMYIYEESTNLTTSEKGKIAAKLRSMRESFKLRGLFKENKGFMNNPLRSFLNLNDNGTPFYDYEEITKEGSGWTEKFSLGSMLHQTFWNGDLHAKFVNEDGREVIFNSDRQTVTNPVDKGTFNYAKGTIRSSIIGGDHFEYDMVPYFNQMFAEGRFFMPRVNIFNPGGLNSETWD